MEYNAWRLQQRLEVTREVGENACLPKHYRTTNHLFIKVCYIRFSQFKKYQIEHFNKHVFI